LSCPPPHSPNIKYCVKCVSIDRSINQCASFVYYEYYEKRCDENKPIGTSIDDLNRYCSETPTRVKIKYKIEVSGQIPFAEKNKCTYTTIFSTSPVEKTHSYLKISILKLEKNGEKKEIFKKDFIDRPDFPIEGDIMRTTPTSGTFILVASYYKGLNPISIIPCEHPDYAAFWGTGTVIHKSGVDFVDLTVTIQGEQPKQQ